MKVHKFDKIDDFEEEKVWSPLELAEMKTGRRVGQIRRAKGFSGRKRMRTTDQSACYHVMSRTVNGEFLLGDIEKEAFRKLMRRMERFAGVEVLTYAVMGNHFHLLLRVPEREKFLRKFKKGSRAEQEERLLDHLHLLYSRPYLAQLKAELAIRDSSKKSNVGV